MMKTLYRKNMGVVLLTVTALTVLPNNKGDAKAIGNERTRRDLTVEQVYDDIPGMIKHAIEKVDKEQKKCSYDHYFSIYFGECKKCDKDCPNGDDITLCGQECILYFLNKTMVEHQRIQEIRNNNYSKKIEQLGQKLIYLTEQSQNQKSLLEESNAEKDKLKDQVKDLSSDLKHNNQKFSVFKEWSIPLMVIFFLILICIICALFIIFKTIRNSHLKVHDQATSDKVDIAKETDLSLSFSTVTSDTASQNMDDGNQETEILLPRQNDFIATNNRMSTLTVTEDEEYLQES